VIEAIRAGHGPALVEGQVIRMDPHSSSDDQRKYRSDEELAALVERDPILQTEKYLLRRHMMSQPEIEALRERIKNAVNQAAEEADAAPPPSPDNVLTHIYSENSPVFEESAPGYVSLEPISMVEAINRGLREEMERNSKIVMWGEDIDDPKGGVFGVTKGLSRAFPGRVQNSALAEASIVGIAGGMAIGGYKPIVEIQFADYSWPAFMQFRDEISTVRWRSNGEWSGPIVLRIAQGGYIKGGPWHSTCVEAMYSHTPGWHVVYPASADDAKGLIKTAARCEDPVIFLEHKGLYRRMQARAPEPDAGYLIPFGRARLRREGSDLSIITWGSTVWLAMELAEQMEKEGVSLEVLDLRSITPLDEEGIYRTVRKTNRALVAHEDSVFMGFGAEVAARIAANCFDALDAPVLRLGADECFVPSAPNLEEAVLPQVADLRAAAERLLKY
jgi:2-oxoisovalerate dehydrogenase E1 component